MRKITMILALALSLGMHYGPAYGMSKRAPSADPQQTSTAAQEETVWVGKSDSAISCQKTRGIEIDKMASNLTAADIKIYAKRKLHDGKMRIQMCGVDKGDMNGFLIPKKDLEKAVALGFQAVPAPPQE